MRLKDANGMANIADPYQTAAKYLIWGLHCLFRLRDNKFFSMLNSAEHEILNAHKYKNHWKFSTF